MANVVVDVDARINERDLRQSELAVYRSLQEMGRESGQAFGREFASGYESQQDKIRAAAQNSARAADQATRAELNYHRALASGDVEEQIRAGERLAKVRNNLASQSDRLAKSQKALHESMTGNFGNAERSVEGLSSRIVDLGQQMQGLSRAGGTGGMAALVPLFSMVAGVAAEASGAVGLLPGVAGAAAAAFGTLKLATMGVTDALSAINDPEKFAAALDELSPSAQRAALAIKGLMPAFSDLQKSTQDALFAGIGPQLTQTVNALLPELRSLTTGVASGFNGLLSGVMSQMTSPEGMVAINTIVSNIVSAFQNLAPAAKPFTDAILQLTSASSSFLPQLATAAADGAKAFSEFISQASRSGQLQDFIQGGIDAMKDLGQITKDALAAFLAMRPIGETVLPLIRDTVHGIAVALEAISPAVATFSPLFMTWRASVLAVEGAFHVVGKAVDLLVEKVNRVLDPLRAVAAISNQLLGTHFEIPRIGAPVSGSPVAAPGSPGGPGGPPTSNPAADAWLRADQAAHPNSPNGLPPGAYRRRDGSVGFAPLPSAQDSIPTPLAGPYAPTTGGSGKGSDGPQVPYPGTDPMSLIPQGLPISASLYQSAQAVIESQYKLAQDQAILNDLEKSNTASAADIQKAKNDIVKDQQDIWLSEQRLNEAKQSATNSTLKANKTAADAFSSIGASLDSDLGISKGLPGLADNLVRFLASLATAPLMGALSQITGGKDASETGSGIVGMATANMPQYQQFSQQAQYPQYSQMPYVPGPMPGLGSDVKAAANHVGEAYSQALRDDCSGTIGQIINEALGIAGGNLPTTSNMQEWLAERGFQPGLGGPGDMSVGWWDGAGNDGHAAATLSNGMNFEQGGSGKTATMGGPVGASSSQFTNQMHRSWTPQYGGGPSIGLPTTTPVAPGAYAPLTPEQLTNPGLTPPPVPTGGGGGMNVPGTMGGPPQALPGLSSSQINNPGQDPNAWQPAGGGGNAGLGGLAMSAISSAISAAGMAGDAAGGGGGGSAAAAAAQMLMQLANRTIAFGGQAAGDLVGGLFETFSVGGSSLADPMQGWLGRVIGSLAGAKPEQQDPNAQGQQDQKAGKGGQYGTYVENFIQAPNRDGAVKVGNDLAFQSAGQGSR